MHLRKRSRETPQDGIAVPSDKNPVAKSRRKVQRAAEAYDVLSNAEKKQRYDQFGHAGMGGAGGFGGAGGVRWEGAISAALHCPISTSFCGEAAQRKEGKRNIRNCYRAHLSLDEIR